MGTTKTGTQLAGGRGKVFSPFLQIEEMCPDFTKKCYDFGKKCPLYVHLWVKFSFKMQF